MFFEKTLRGFTGNKVAQWRTVMIIRLINNVCSDVELIDYEIEEYMLIKSEKLNT